MAGLRQVAAGNPAIREVRGRGLMVGVEMATPDAASAAQAGCLGRGLIVELGGRGNTVVRFLPPLVLTDGQADTIEKFDIFADTVADAASETVEAELSAVTT